MHSILIILGILCILLCISRIWCILRMLRIWCIMCIWCILLRILRILCLLLWSYNKLRKPYKNNISYTENQTKTKYKTEFVNKHETELKVTNKDRFKIKHWTWRRCGARVRTLTDQVSYSRYPLRRGTNSLHRPWGSKEKLRGTIRPSEASVVKMLRLFNALNFE